MGRYWGKILKNHKIVRDTVADGYAAGTAADFEQMIQALCDPLDLPRPVILSKHLRDMGEFRHTRFRADDFMEEVPFDSFEVEELNEKKKG